MSSWVWTRLNAHVAVALDWLGRRLDTVSVPADARGYQALVAWAEGLGTVVCSGVERTSSYGAGFARHLSGAGIKVLEGERPKRRHLGSNGKSDPKDAEAARVVLAGDVAGEPKSGDGRVEMIRALRVARRSAVKPKARPPTNSAACG